MTHLSDLICKMANNIFLFSCHFWASKLRNDAKMHWRPKGHTIYIERNLLYLSASSFGSLRMPSLYLNLLCGLLRIISSAYLNHKDWCLPMSYGCGKGSSADMPNVIYLALKCCCSWTCLHALSVGCWWLPGLTVRQLFSTKQPEKGDKKERKLTEQKGKTIKGKDNGWVDNGRQHL